MRRRQTVIDCFIEECRSIYDSCFVNHQQMCAHHEPSPRCNMRARNLMVQILSKMQLIPWPSDAELAKSYLVTGRITDILQSIRELDHGWHFCLSHYSSQHKGCIMCHGIYGELHAGCVSIRAQFRKTMTALNYMEASTIDVDNFGLELDSTARF